jgi:putative sugar O-methyltransferase
MSGGTTGSQALHRELPGLAAMLEEMGRAPEIFRPSRFWEHHNAVNLEQLAARGFAAFKRTVNTNYFQWEPGSPLGSGPREQVSRRLLAVWLRRPDPRVFAARLDRPEDSVHSGLRARWHAIAVAMLWEHARRSDALGALRLEEPSLGGAVTVRHRDRHITEDLAHSTLELATLAQAGALPHDGSLVIELGAGYGRVGWLLMNTVPGIRYLVCDIPPALAIAQRYLTSLLPERLAFRFRAFSDPGEVADELAASSLAFLLPHQLAQLGPLDAELFINVSSLHEMRPEQIALWFELIDRHTNGHFYTKQWVRSVNVFDELVVERRSYPVPGHWRVLLDRRPQVPPGFFEAVYGTRTAAAP